MVSDVSYELFPSSSEKWVYIYIYFFFFHPILKIFIVKYGVLDVIQFWQMSKISWIVDN